MENRRVFTEDEKRVEFSTVTFDLSPCSEREASRVWRELEQAGVRVESVTVPGVISTPDYGAKVTVAVDTVEDIKAAFDEIDFAANREHGEIVEETAWEMCEALRDYADDMGVLGRLQDWDLTTDNHHRLDDIFNDGGYARCERFTDLASDAALAEGYEFESEGWDDLRWRIIDRAFEIWNTGK